MTKRNSAHIFVDGGLDRESVVKEFLTTAVIVWESTHKPKKGRPKPRIKLFLEEEQYLLILEQRREYYLLITAYRVDEDWKLKSIAREARKKGVNAGSAC